MRGSPSCRFLVIRFGAWRAAVAVLVVASVAVLAAWAVASSHDGFGLAQGFAALVSIVVIGAGAGLWRRPALGLRWDGEAWSLSDLRDPGSEVVGRLQAMIDLGSFLLLRFRPDAGQGVSTSARWIPLGRAGLERDWHAIRCAVHGPVAASNASREPAR